MFQGHSPMRERDRSLSSLFNCLCGRIPARCFRKLLSLLCQAAPYLIPAIIYQANGIYCLSFSITLADINRNGCVGMCCLIIVWLLLIASVLGFGAGFLETCSPAVSSNIPLHIKIYHFWRDHLTVTIIL